jgi:hypothetical protein
MQNVFLHTSGTLLNYTLVFSGCTVVSTKRGCKGKDQDVAVKSENEEDTVKIFLYFHIKFAL